MLPSNTITESVCVCELMLGDVTIDKIGREGVAIKLEIMRGGEGGVGGGENKTHNA